MPRLRSDDLAWQEVDGEIVCLDLATSRYLAVNATGAALWPLLVSGASTDELVDHVTTVFGVDGDTARTDVDAFVGELARRDLLADGGR